MKIISKLLVFVLFVASFTFAGPPSSEAAIIEHRDTTVKTLTLGLDGTFS
ncbi:hypothetical protein [Desulfofalx alkaliphila]|nr:hypothetical protein [Desulfofalx alkaliphila]